MTTPASVEGSDPVHPDAPARWGRWTWREPTHGEHFRRCSYCDSVHPDDLAAEPAWRPEWADRKYGWPHKFYVDIPNRDPDALFAIGSTSGATPGIAGANLDWVAVGDLSVEQRAVVDRDRALTDYTTFIGFGTRPNHFGKIYTVHLADPQIEQEVKDKIAVRSGLRFEFLDGGRIKWEAA